jgi:hypothetical protein
VFLKLKALFYRYTGFYLAHREELDYITSKEFWKEFKKLYSHKDNDMSPRDLQGLLIGMWQCKYGFATVMYRGKYKILKPFFIFFSQLKMDTYWRIVEILGSISKS